MIRIGIVCPSEIALRRFLPALQKAKDKIQFTAIGIASPEEWFGDLTAVSQEQISEQQDREFRKAQTFTDNYGGEIIVGYGNIVSSDKIDAVYIPLPPSLHFKWAAMALKTGKHVFVEKPSATNLEDTDELIRLAASKKLALHENYMFIYHEQLKAVDRIVKSGEIGDVRLFRITFGFPLRQLNDFRYNKSLGGGALLDAGGYCLKYANYLLGGDSRVVTANANFIDGFEVDMYGNATLVNSAGKAAQIAFGMDNDYRCDLEVWGSKGTITTGRILTAPDGYAPTCSIKKNQDVSTLQLPADDAFLKSIERFVDCVENMDACNEEYRIIHDQEVLVEQFKTLAGLSDDK